MVTVHSLDVNGMIFTGMQVELPGTTIFIIMNDVGYIMSTSFLLQWSTMNDADEETIGGYVANVTSVDDLLHAPLEQITKLARKKGWFIGMRGKDALLKII